MTRALKRQPTAHELVPAMPANLDSATEMMMEAVRDFQRAALRQAVLVSHARTDLFGGEAGPWLSWCMDTCHLSRRYAITLWHAGDLLRECGNAALLGCDADKLELLSKLDDRKLTLFLSKNNPSAMSRQAVRKKVAAYLGEDDPGDAGPETTPRKSPRDLSPVAKHLRAMDVLAACWDDDDVCRVMASQASPTACIEAALACFDVGLHLLSTECCWDEEQLRRWENPIKSVVSLYEDLIKRAQLPEA